MELIRTKERKKGRGGVCPHRINFFTSALERGDELEPIRVNALKDGAFVVKEGRHRTEAHRLAGLSQIWAVVENIMGRLLRGWTRLRFATLDFVFGWYLFLLKNLKLGKEITEIIRPLHHFLRLTSHTQRDVKPAWKFTD